MMIQREHYQFLWRVTALHTIAYFIAGVFALVFMGYREQFGTGFLSVIMLPIDSPWVALGPSLQIVRGLLIAMVLLPLKNVLILHNGWIKLAALIFGLSYLSTIGPTFGSFDGYIYTKIPLEYHLLGLPEAVLYIFLFSFLFGMWYRYPRNVWNTAAAVSLFVIVLMSVLGFFANTLTPDA